MNPNSRKKSLASLENFCIFPLTMAHTFLARGHSHKICPLVLGCWPHTTSTWTFLLCKLSRIGKLFEHALQTKFHTFRGTLSDHIFLQIGLSDRAAKCSIGCYYFNLSATWYAVLTEKVFDLLSIHIRESQDCRLLRGNARISNIVLRINKMWIFPLSHCLVSSSIRSRTRNLGSGLLMKNGSCESHLFVVTPIRLPSPIRHLDPPMITFQATNRLLHTNERIVSQLGLQECAAGKI